MKEAKKILKPSLSLSEDNANLIIELAKKERRNLSNFIAYILEDYIYNYKKNNIDSSDDTKKGTVN